MLLNQGLGPNGQVISNTTLAEIQSAQSSLYPSPNQFVRFYSPLAQQNITINDFAYGFGWIREDYRGRQHIWHNGAVFGMNAQVSLLPDDGHAVVLFANRDQASTVLFCFVLFC